MCFLLQITACRVPLCVCVAFTDPLWSTLQSYTAIGTILRVSENFSNIHHREIKQVLEKRLGKGPQGPGRVQDP